MRIISGTFKGRIISFLDNKITRPLRDSVRENIFNLITHSKNININLENTNVLDLYSGVGSFGLECISRGAKNIQFVEKNLEPLNILKKNINNFSIQDKSIIFERDIRYFFDQSENLKPFDLIFLDPPYADKDYIQILDLIYKNKIFKKEHLVIIHREKNSEENFGKILKVLFIKNYGRSKIIFGTFI
tara:strand:- start:148 stop:711 length:564 start_codon:yes stop_codon:yes gene_type:complete